MKKNGELSGRQNDILTFIKKYIAKNGYSPSVREIAHGVNLSSPATVHIHIQNLIQKGYLKRASDSHKLLELMVPNEFELHEHEAVAVPFIDRSNIKNFKSYFEKPDKFFFLSAQMIPRGSEVFVYQIDDDSMSNIGIYDNDNLIVEKTNRASNGDIVIAYNQDSNIIVGTFYKDKPSRDLLSPIVFSEAIILGKVVSLFREF